MAYTASKLSLKNYVLDANDNERREFIYVTADIAADIDAAAHYFADAITDGTLKTGDIVTIISSTNTYFKQVMLTTIGDFVYLSNADT
jgi:methionine aminopeptidase